ncbi:hypothetical protein [uncultured Bacteroides sp.]|jgi:hypothetical protein|uniref:hypothetical protein n=1 Tax=uncultured Bacteroides sp. TaxID=162156 RepID=UPI00280AFD6A|nr:hypothetical protein [uncultured Bacteroides sp.]
MLIIKFYQNEKIEKKCRPGTNGCRRGIKKKTTRDVIMPYVRWTEAMRVVRACHPEVTVIMPEEKIQLRPGDDVRVLIGPYVRIICRALDDGKVGEWHGHTAECRVRQVRIILSHYFRFQKGCIGDAALDSLLDDLMYVHKSCGI